MSVTPKPISLLVGVPALAARLEKHAIYEPTSGCLLWIGALFKNGRGQIVIDGKTWYASRVAYFVAYGLFDENLDVCHKCDNGACIESRHLFLGSHLDNMRDRDIKSRGVVPNLRGEDSAVAKLTESDIVEIFNARAGGWTYARIADRFGISVSHVETILYRRRWSHVRIAPETLVLVKLSRNSNRKLSESDVSIIHSLSEGGWRNVDIARRFEVCDQTICNILSGRSWQREDA